jgi:hypothetical protein
MISENDIIIEDDLKIVNGDISIENANNQNIKHLMIANAGNFYIKPKIGASLYLAQNSSITDYRLLVSRIKSELKNDGYDNIKITGTYDDETQGTELKITAERVTYPK